MLCSSAACLGARTTSTDIWALWNAPMLRSVVFGRLPGRAEKAWRTGLVSGRDCDAIAGAERRVVAPKIATPRITAFTECCLIALFLSPDCNWGLSSDLVVEFSARSET